LIEDIVTLEQFHTRFDSEESCADFLFQLRWPEGFACPRCGHRHAYKTATRRLPLYECASCRRQTSLTVGTIMEGSRTELRKWLLAMFLVARPEGINAVELSRNIRVTYKTAWLILHKIRHAMEEGDKATLLSGSTHVNVASYGRPRFSSYLRHPKEQPLFIGATMNDQGEPAYVKIKRIPEPHMRDIQILRVGTEAFKEKHIQPSATVEFIVHRFKPIKYQRLLPVFEKANRWINDTFHGLGARHLQAYFNEYCYRLNLRLKNEQVFNKLLLLCNSSKAITYTALTG
jgi:transposase-like protein